MSIWRVTRFRAAPVQPIDDCFQGQTVVAHLAVVLGALARRKTTVRNRARVLEHSYLVAPLFHRDVVASLPAGNWGEHPVHYPGRDRLMR